MPSVISCLKENARRYPDRPAVSDAVQTLSYGELWQKAQAVAAHLHELNLPDGSNVLVEARADVSFVAAAMGIHLGKFVFVPVENRASSEVAQRYAEMMDAPLFLGENRVAGRLHFPTAHLLESAGTGGGDRHFPLPEEDRLAEILFTTGTTGRSKGVMLSHRAVWASADNNFQTDRLKADSVYLIASPLNHINALRKLYSCFLGGAHAVLLEGFLDLKRFYEAIEKHQANVLLLPPAALRYLLSVSGDKLQTLAEVIQVVHTNSAPLTETDKEMMRQRLPHSRLIFGYGTTEAGSVSSAYDYAEKPGMANCVGRTTPHTRITIVDEKRRRISATKEAPGFLAITGDALMTGYWRDPGRTAEVLQDHTLYTQDLGYTDENGFLFVIGRAGDIINCGGLKIAPVEIENAAMQYPSVRDCACFGVHDPIAGQAVKLHLVPADERAFDHQAFRQFLQTKLENHQIPRYVECVKTIPKTLNGKIDRKRLAREDEQNRR